VQPLEIRSVLAIALLGAGALLTASALAQPPNGDAPDGWRAVAGRWRGTGKALLGGGYLDSRLVSRAPAPDSLSWKVRLQLKDG
jgi:hypothetical protein